MGRLNSISGSDELTADIKELVQNTLVYLSDQVTRIEVHLSDTAAAKDSKLCMIEARLEGRQPTAVTHAAATVKGATKGAADKLKSALDSMLGRLRHNRR